MSQTVLEPQATDNKALSGRWMAVIFDNDTTYVGKVVETLMRATRCTQEEALMETWEAQAFGKACVHFAARQECDEIARIMRSIGVVTEVSPEWND